jgi:alpha-tubulin suppressor-like RCC1 family protein
MEPPHRLDRTGHQPARTWPSCAASSTFCGTFDAVSLGNGRCKRGTTIRQTRNRSGNGPFVHTSPDLHHWHASACRRSSIIGPRRVDSITSNDASSCALLASRQLYCWGLNQNGELGNGSSDTGQSVPEAVEGVGGRATLGGIRSVASEGSSSSDGASYCAVLISGSVDCWGYGYYGELGNGKFYTRGSQGSPVPVPVSGVNGSGALAGVVSLRW